MGFFVVFFCRRGGERWWEDFFGDEVWRMLWIDLGELEVRNRKAAQKCENQRNYYAILGNFPSVTIFLIFI